MHSQQSLERPDSRENFFRSGQSLKVAMGALRGL